MPEKPVLLVKGGESGGQWRDAQRNSLWAGPGRVTQGSPCLGVRDTNLSSRQRASLLPGILALHPHVTGWVGRRMLRRERLCGRGPGEVVEAFLHGHPFLPLLLATDSYSLQDQTRPGWTNLISHPGNCNCRAKEEEGLLHV